MRNDRPLVPGLHLLWSVQRWFVVGLAVPWFVLLCVLERITYSAPDIARYVPEEVFEYVLILPAAVIGWKLDAVLKRFAFIGFLAQVITIFTVFGISLSLWRWPAPPYPFWVLFGHIFLTFLSGLQVDAGATA